CAWCEALRQIMGVFSSQFLDQRNKLWWSSSLVRIASLTLVLLIITEFDAHPHQQCHSFELFERRRCYAACHLVRESVTGHNITDKDFGSKEDCGASQETGTGGRLLCCSFFSSVINHHPLTFSFPDIRTKEGRHEDTPSPTPQGTLCPLGHLVLPHGSRGTFPRLIKMGTKRGLVWWDHYFQVNWFS
ncbi:hypothetical protein XENORESO_000585, partial [Xenotaenia resolanae]